MILVTGGAGFIGSNFVLDWLAQSDEPVVNVEKLTYAGNLNNLASLCNDTQHIFGHADICDSDKMQELLVHTGRVPSCTSLRKVMLIVPSIVRHNS